MYFDHTHFVYPWDCDLQLQKQNLEKTGKKKKKKRINTYLHFSIISMTIKIPRYILILKKKKRNNTNLCFVEMYSAVEKYFPDPDFFCVCVYLILPSVLVFPSPCQRASGMSNLVYFLTRVFYYGSCHNPCVSSFSVKYRAFPCSATRSTPRLSLSLFRRFLILSIVSHF